MINVWKYEDETRPVIVTLTNGMTFQGIVSEVVDANEDFPEESFGEDSIGLLCNNGYFGIKESEIQSIELAK